MSLPPAPPVSIPKTPSSASSNWPNLRPAATSISTSPWLWQLVQALEWKLIALNRTPPDKSSPWEDWLRIWYRTRA